MNQIKEKNFALKPYIIADFVSTTLANGNFEDMQNYTNQVIEDFRNKIN
jgi:hypothetical protein